MDLKQNISLAHGSGGKLTHDLIKDLFLEKFKNPILSPLTDSAILNINGAYLAFTTDTYVVKPLFFPGGDIGKLAVCGTINDLAVMGANPICISCGLVIEEGFEYKILEQIIDSMGKTALDTGVQVVTGDTKVVEKGGCDGIFINTSGIGLVKSECRLLPEDIQVGDKIILNGPIGDHGIAVLSARENLGLSSEIKSDCAPLWDLISQVLDTSKNGEAKASHYNKIKFMRDITRGGLATILNEIVDEKSFGIRLKEKDIPVREEVKGACEILGFDPLYIANEGKVVLVVASEDAPLVLREMRRHPLGEDAQIIGEIVSEPEGKVCLKTLAGGTRIVDMMTRDQLPRIC